MALRTAALIFERRRRFFLHALPTKVEVAVLQANVLVDVVSASVDRERRWRGRTQDLDFAVTDFDLAGWQVVIDRSLRAHTDGARDLEDVFAADVDIVVDDALDDARVVAQINKCEVFAMLTSTTNPATHTDGATNIGFAELSAKVGTHRCCLPRAGLSRKSWFSHEFRFSERDFLKDVQ